MLERMKRTYLTSEEIRFIVKEMLKTNDAFAREMIKYGIIAQFLMDGFEDFTNLGEIYDYLMENNFNICNVVDNIGTLEKIVANELSVETTVKHFLDDISNKIDEYCKNLDKTNLEHLIEEFNKLGNSQVIKSDILSSLVSE